jgi:hypothetical protein
VGLAPRRARRIEADPAGPTRRIGMEPQRTWQRAGLMGLAVLSGLGATSLAAGVLWPEAPPSLGGLRLGMTPDDVRARFSPGRGSFRSEISGTDTALVHEAEGSEPARFEFHDGQLVAVRLVLPLGAADASGPALRTTPGSVLVRRVRDASSVEARLLSRTCPTHHGEAERLVAGGVSH